MEDAALGQAVRNLAAGWVRWSDEHDRQVRAVELAERVGGSRTVTGGQIQGDRWEIRDRETNELLASGDTYESYQEAWQPEWMHEDWIYDKATPAADTHRPKDNGGLPASLADAIQEWVFENIDDARALVG